MKNRLPTLQEIAPVYAVIACMIYGWTLILYFWKLPSWLDFMTPAEAFGAFSYGMLTNTIESLMILVLLLGLCVILPKRLLRDAFVVRGTIMMLVSIGSLMLYQYQYRATRHDFVGPMPYWLVSVIVLIVILIFITEKIKPLQVIFTDLSDRLIIFLYLLIPLSIICILDVIARNLG